MPGHFAELSSQSSGRGPAAPLAHKIGVQVQTVCERFRRSTRPAHRTRPELSLELRTAATRGADLECIGIHQRNRWTPSSRSYAPIAGK